MKTIEYMMITGKVSRATVYLRLKKIEEVTGKIEKEYQDGKTNPDRIVPDNIAEMVINYRGKKPGRKPLGNTSLTTLTKEEIEAVLK